MSQRYADKSSVINLQLERLLVKYPNLKNDLFGFEKLRKAFYASAPSYCSLTVDALSKRPNVTPNCGQVMKLLRAITTVFTSQTLNKENDTSLYHKMAERLGLVKKYIKPGIYVWEKPLNLHKEKSDSDVLTESNES